jgi:hypothetical protein
MAWWSKWFRKEKQVASQSEDVDFGVDIRIGFANGERSWTEEANILECLADVLKKTGIQTARHDRFLVIEPGIKLFPRLRSFEPRHPSGIHTVTTVETIYSSQIPAGTFEYQHAVGDDLNHALAAGFEGWAKCDLPVFLDMVNGTLAECTSIESKKPANATTPETLRRVLLGPPTRAMVNPTDASSDHDFCHCCLLTNCHDAFKELFDGDAFAGVRMYAARDADGVAQADCRVNGHDFPAGQSALIKYASTWPGTGIEFRKQYIVFEPRRPA